MPVVVARGAAVRHRRRWVFRELDVTITAGETVAVVGPPGSGRTTVLLALVRRFRLSAGTIDLAGTGSLGYVRGVAEPEPVMTVAECIRERLAMLGRRRNTPVDLWGLDPERKAWQLSPYERQVLGLVLARLGEPVVIALDGVDQGLDAGEQAALWKRLAELTADGVAVIVTVRSMDPERVSTVIRLGVEGAAVVEEYAPAVGPQAPAEEPQVAGPQKTGDLAAAQEPGKAGLRATYERTAKEPEHTAELVAANEPEHTAALVAASEPEETAALVAAADPGETAGPAAGEPVERAADERPGADEGRRSGQAQRAEDQRHKHRRDEDEHDEDERDEDER